MNAEEFLRFVWPDKGLYCITYSFIARDKKEYVGNKIFRGIAGALAFVNERIRSSNLWFAIHAVDESTVTYGQTTDVRKHKNMRAARAFFFDLDVGNVEEKYASQMDAIRGLVEFCEKVNLPKPLTVSSGGGVHVYWVVEDEIPSLEWLPIATKLKALAFKHGLKVDPSRTTDRSSVLRVAGTFNIKQRQNPRPVLVKGRAVRIPNAEFIQLIEDALVRADVRVNEPIVYKEKSAIDEILGSNIEHDIPPVNIRTVAEFCTQTQRLIRLGGNVSEPEWKASLQLVMNMENGDKLIHKISEKHPEYDYDATERKVAPMREKGILGTSCEVLQDRCGAQHCIGCPFEHEPKGNPERGTKWGPLVFAQRWLRSKSAPPPVITVEAGGETKTITIPPPPKPFKRLENGAISMTMQKDDKKSYDVIILDHDLYPVRRLSNQAAKQASVVWRAATPHDGDQEFVMDANVIHDLRALPKALANNHVWVNPDNAKEVQRYMVAYIKELQRLSASELQQAHFGWGPDMKTFVLADKIYSSDGTFTEAHLVGNAVQSDQYIAKAGTLEKQVELLNFFNGPNNLRMQFMVLCGMGSPLMAFTPQHGGLVNAQGPSGSAKTTVLKAAASIWGSPDDYIVNGLSDGSSTKGRYERSATLCNLPLCIDEYTNHETTDIISLAMGATQPGARVILNRASEERRSQKRLKANIALVTSNTSLVRKAGDDITTGVPASMRIIEILFPRLPDDLTMKSRGDQFLLDLRRNHGHIGELLARYYVTHTDELERRITDRTIQIERNGHLVTADRVRVAMAACALVAGEIAREMGLISYDIAAIESWFIGRQVPQMKVDTVIFDAAGILTDFLNAEIGNSISIVPGHGGGTYAIKDPRISLNVRYDVDQNKISIAETPFYHYCQRRGVDIKDVRDALLKSGAIASPENARTRVVMSKGTSLPRSGQVRCLVVEMNHPDIAGGISEISPTLPVGPQSIGGNVVALKKGA